MFFLVVSTRELAIIQICVERILDQQKENPTETQDFIRELNDVALSLGRKPLAIGPFSVMQCSADA